jgi:hypothetical protein
MREGSRCSTRAGDIQRWETSPYPPSKGEIKAGSRCSPCAVISRGMRVAKPHVPSGASDASPSYSPFQGGVGGCIMPLTMTKRQYFSYDPRLRQLARNLRKNRVLGEVLLWQRLRRRQMQRQQALEQLWGGKHPPAPLQRGNERRLAGLDVCMDILPADLS